jgi:PPOX class probable F420-dependent enzyme
MADRTSPIGSGDFASLEAARYIMLTTFKPDGVPASAVVHGIAEDGRAYFRVWSHSGTARNLRHTREVQAAPCAMRGFVSLGPALDAVARLLPAGEAGQVAGKLARKYPFQQRFLMPLLRLGRRGEIVHYELVGCEAVAAETDDLRSKEPGSYRITVVRSTTSFPWP